MPKIKDLTGQCFGRLTVVKMSNVRKNNQICWDCICDCGTYVEAVRRGGLRSGQTTSCGCYNKERQKQAVMKDLTGQRFGKLVAIKPLETRAGGEVIWLCQCDCGNTKEVRMRNLVRGATYSCGCLKQSYGEYKIEELLQKNNIDFITEKSFDTCVNPKTNTKLRFDFYINNEYLIEFDGIEHYEKTGGRFDSKYLAEIQYRDNIKNQWCKENNIPLIRIPYTKLNSLTIEDLKLPSPAQPTV